MSRKYYITDWFSKGNNNFIDRNILSDLFPSLLDSSSSNIESYKIEGAKIIEFKVPGFTQDDLTLELEDGYLTVSGERTKPNAKTETIKYCYAVDDNYTIDDIRAKIENGILKVTLETPEKQTKRLIEIH